jgi:hypothetical protein
MTSPTTRILLATAAAFFAAAAVAQQPGQAVEQVLGNWGLPGAVVAVAILLYIGPEIGRRWRGRDAAHDLAEALTRLGDTLTQIQIRLNQLPTSVEVRDMIERQQTAGLQPVISAIERVGQTVERQTDAVRELIRDRIPRERT